MDIEADKRLAQQQTRQLVLRPTMTDDELKDLCYRVFPEPAHVKAAREAEMQEIAAQVRTAYQQAEKEAREMGVRLNAISEAKARKAHMPGLTPPTQETLKRWWQFWKP